MPIETRRLNIHKSQQISKRIHAYSGHCYDNACRAVRKYPGMTYVQGYAVWRGRVLPNAWIELEGEIIDPTWCNRVLATPKDAWDNSELFGVNLYQPMRFFRPCG